MNRPSLTAHGLIIAGTVPADEGRFIPPEDDDEQLVFGPAMSDGMPRATRAEDPNKAEEHGTKQRRKVVR